LPYFLLNHVAFIVFSSCLNRPHPKPHVFLLGPAIELSHLVVAWNQSINQSTRIYIAPYVAGESEE